MAKPKSQSGPVRTAPRYATFRSDGALARALLVTYPQMQWTLGARSLAAKIGNLEHGETVWWVNHPEHAHCLAALLDISLADLGLHAQARRSHLFEFEDFREMPPIDLTREAMWTLQFENMQPTPNKVGKSTGGQLANWVSPALWTGRLPHDRDWLHVADDMERLLLARSLAAAGHFDVLYVEQLTDVAERLRGNAPLVVVIRADGGVDDLAALALRPETAGILVIAPFMLPVRRASSSVEFVAWESFATSGQERDAFTLSGLVTSAFGKSVQRWEVKRLPDWRASLLAWVDAHLNRHAVDSLFSAQGIASWLAQVDPSGAWFTSASDVMQLCQMAHWLGEKLPRNQDESIGCQLAILLFAREGPSLHLQVQQLAEARWQDARCAWHGALPLESWRALAAQRLRCVAVQPEAVAAEQQGTSPAPVANSANVRGVTDQPGDLMVSGLLKQVRRGYFDFQHRMLARLLVRDRLVWQITAQPAASWSLACFDAERRAVVDAALDAVSIAGLVGAMTRLSDDAPHCAARIGAVEALFMAVGRRMELHQAVLPLPVPIVASVLDRLDLVDVAWALPAPWTRPTHSQAACAEWIAACWSWSLLVDAPTALCDNWLFPGWCTPPAAPAAWLETLWPEDEEAQLLPAWRQFFSIINIWVKDLELPIANPPRILVIGLLGKAARGGWAAEAAWWQTLLVNPGDSRWVCDRLVEAITIDEGEAALRLWPSFVEHERADTGQFVRLSAVRRWMLRHLAPADALACLDESARRYLAEVPESLPPHFRAPLLKSLSKHALVARYSEVALFFRRFGPSAAPTLAGFLDHELLGEEAAACLWEWDPASAQALMDARVAECAGALSRLILTCPTSHLGAAVACLHAMPGLLVGESRAWWIRQHLSEAGIHAPSLLDLLVPAPGRQ